MIRHALFLTALILELSCNSSRQERKFERYIISSGKTAVKVPENIRFDFTVSRLDSFKETIEVNASIFNDNSDTVCFLSSSCEGEQYSLKHNEAKFILTPFLRCNISRPVLYKIAPKESHTFQAHFKCDNKETRIKLGFDFHAVDKSFDLTNIKSVSDVSRPADQQSIIWSEERIIK